MRPIVITKSLAAADQDGIAQSQTTAGAGDLTLNGAFVTDGVATLDTQRLVAITSGADLSGITFTVYGTDDQNRSISEAIAGPNATTVVTSLNFLTITQVETDAAVGSAVEVGTSGVGATAPVPLDWYLTSFEVTLRVDVTGTLDYTVQYTIDNPFDSSGPLTWVDHADLTAQTVSNDGTLISPVGAVRLLINSGTGTGQFTVLQAGVQ
jgi:hypothetical protein